MNNLINLLSKCYGRVNIDEERVKVSAQRAEIKATVERMGANLDTRSYRKSRT